MGTLNFVSVTLYLLGEAFPGDSIVTAPACALTTMPGSYAHPQEVLLLTAGLPHSWVLCVAGRLTPCLAQRLVSSVR